MPKGLTPVLGQSRTAVRSYGCPGSGTTIWWDARRLTVGGSGADRRILPPSYPLRLKSRPQSPAAGVRPARRSRSQATAWLLEITGTP